jgi:organic radical activating enzyme
MEVSFSRVCNLKCSYCSAQFSTRWQNEIDEFGPYPTGHGKPTHIEIAEDNNPYIAAFWKWWPEVKKSLKVFRITGGEPLLSPNTFRVFESLIIDGEADLEVAVNSNLMAPPAVMRKFLELVPRLESRVKQFRLFTSIDGWGPQAEYIRHGLVLSEMWKNVERFLSASRSPLVFMVTLNALSLFSIKQFFENLMQLRKQFPNQGGADSLLADISYLQNPVHQSLKILPREFWSVGDEILYWMKQNLKSDDLPHGLLQHEVVKFERALAWMKEPLAERQTQEGNFHTFFVEHDRRRKTDFRRTFPELALWLDRWGQTSGDSNAYQFYMGAKRGYQSVWKVWAKYRGLMRL